MCGVCLFPKICVIYRQTDAFIALDMRAPSLLLLTFIFTAAEYPLHISAVNGDCKNSEIPRQKNYGNTPPNISYEENARFRMPCIEGYLRRAGTSNLFRCQNKNTDYYIWENDPSLECIPDPRKLPISTDNPITVSNTLVHKTAPNLITSIPSTTEKYCCTTTEKPKSTSATSGQTAFTTTHTTAPTTGTSHHTPLRTTTKEEESMTTANSITLSSSATLTVRENLTTVSSQSTSSSNTTTTTDTDTDTDTDFNTRTDPGTIAAGTVLLLIVVVASAAGILLWCRRFTVERTNPPPGSDQPLLNLATSLNSCPDSVQCTPLSMENSAQDLKTDPLIVVQQA
ncbi:interleukin-15 receptor subunit alpha isoform X1 [Salminus brasiliensis]|uniref:interleukin-15 receptor subunit alpha isoform X1 n=1 Tax=Salminus brasiliensis TaxID=930266 RepID=UPI003B831F06